MTEPWISRLVASFVMARGARSVLETGCFLGATSVWLHDALERLGGGDLHLCDIDPERLEHSIARLPVSTSVHSHPHSGDVLNFLRTTEETFDAVWLDDSHEKAHVTRELTLLYPKMQSGGLILMHDIDGVCDLKTVVRSFGGYSIECPRLGPSGGLGVIQVN